MKFASNGAKQREQCRSDHWQMCKGSRFGLQADFDDLSLTARLVLFALSALSFLGQLLQHSAICTDQTVFRKTLTLMFLYCSIDIPNAYSCP